ncbi:MAG: ribulose-phosphate 3-epimerase [Deltaproteobacteria bacterium]
MKKLIVPSILSADFARLGDEIRAVKDAGADWIHVDVMDGHFVPNISIGIPVVESIAKINPPPMDIHLQIENADRFVDAFITAGAPCVKLITVQAEACRLLHSTVSRIKSRGAMAGVALSPSVPISAIEEILPYIDLVLVMTVEPGFPGQRFIKSMIPKISRLREWIDKSAHKPLIEVDGGIKLDNIRAVADAGADVIVSGSGIFGADDYKNIIALMRAEAQ